MIAFKKGDRVRLCDSVRDVYQHSVYKDRLGTIASNCNGKSRRGGTKISVIWDGRKSAESWHEESIERVEIVACPDLSQVSGTPEGA
jgi:hypothetical protein